VADNIQAIKDRLDLTDYLRQYLELKPAGKNLKALCPFHKEKTPSFMVSPERQIWHCFGGCNDGGDIFKFVMKYENTEFYEALKILAEKAGIVLERVNPANRRQEELLFEINEAAQEFFKKQPLPEKYLISRGLKPETIEEFELGAAPQATDALLKYLTKAGFRPQETEQAGLVFKTERGTYWDRFRNRLMFPLHNAFGKIVGFTGRVLEGSGADAAKYVNSPETPIFSKSKFLYGWHKVKATVREDRAAVLVEGQMDFLMSWQDGLKNAVATSGTALTNEHLKILKRSADKLILAFDTDLAGRAATERSIDLAEAADFEVRVAILPSKDPADLVREKPGLLAQLTERAQPAMEYYFSRYLTGPAEIYQKKNSIRLVLGKIRNVLSPVARSQWLKKMADLTDIEERVLEEELTQLKYQKTPPPAAVPEAAAHSIKLSRYELIAQEIVSSTIHGGEKPEPEMRDFLPPFYTPLFDYVARPDKHFNLAPELVALLNLIELRPAQITPLKALQRELQKEYYKNQCQRLRLELKTAEQAGDEERSRRLLSEFDQMSKKVHII